MTGGLGEEGGGMWLRLRTVAEKDKEAEVRNVAMKTGRCEV